MFNIVSLALACTSAKAASNKNYHVPSFTISSLLHDNDNRLKDTLSTSGILAITPSNPKEYEITSQKALSSLCTCQYNANHKDYMSHNVLADGTHRTTIGTATIKGWNHPLPLSDSISDACQDNANKEMKEDMEHLRDLVINVSQVFVQAVDQLLLQTQAQDDDDVKKGKSVLMEDTHGTSYTSLQGIIQGSTSLEHFHLYDKPAATHDDYFYEAENTIAAHTDAGLFLSFVPAHPCSSSSTNNDDEDGDDDDAFFVEIDGTLRRAIFPPNSVIIMLGSGMEHWIDHHENVSFRATKHAVKMKNDNYYSSSSRAWYGMMHLVPPDAIIQRYPTIQTFSDMRSSMTLSSRNQKSASINDDNVITIGCGNHHHQEESQLEMEDNILPTRSHRRLQHVSGPEACNNVTQFMCWLICLDIPDHTNAVSHLQEGESLYCLDPAIYAKSGGSIKQAVEPCSDRKGVMGNVMNEACMGSWLPTSHLVPGFALEVDGKNIADVSSDALNDIEDQYCHGATSMYMDGFNWKGTTCVVYLFQSWVLSSQGKFIVACLGTILAAIVLEYVILSRRTVVMKVPCGYKRLLTSTVLYGVQMTLGYFVMLVIMTYSGPLFLCVVVGLMIGHVCTNYKRLLMGKNEGCCDTAVVVQDGITPCCQYDVGAGKNLVKNDDDEGGKGDLSSKVDYGECCGSTKDVSFSDEENFRHENFKPCCSMGEHA